MIETLVSLIIIEAFLGFSIDVLHKLLDSVKFKANFLKFRVGIGRVRRRL